MKFRRIVASFLLAVFVFLTVGNTAALADISVKSSSKINQVAINTTLVANQSSQTTDEEPVNVLPDNWNDIVPQGAIQNEVTNDGNPAFPYIDLSNPLADTTGKASKEFISEFKKRSDIIQEKGYQIGGIIYYEAPNPTWEVATDFGNTEGIGFASKDNGLALAIALNQHGNRSGLAPASFLAVGSGIEGLLPDFAVTNIYREVYTPTLQQTGSWEEAHIAFLDAVIGELNGEGAYSTVDGAEAFAVLVILIFLLFVFFVLAVACASSGSGGGGYYSSSSSSGGGWSSGGGGSGGGGFGGGGFSGGGGGN